MSDLVPLPDDEPELEVLPPTTHYTSLGPYGKKTIDRASRKLEADLGGREEILANLLTTALPVELEPFVEALSAEENAALNLNQIAAKAGCTVAAMLRLYGQAIKERAQLISMAHVAQRLPQVTRDSIELSTIRENTCRRCKGSGQVRKPGRPRKDATDADLLQECPDCHGMTTVIAEPSVPQQRTALELGGLLEKTPLVQNTIQQNSAVISGAGDLVATQRAVHALLSRSPLGGAVPPQPPADAPPVVDGTVLPGDSEQP